MLKEHLVAMKEVFNNIDKFNDLVVQRKRLLEDLRSDVRIIKLLHVPAMYVASINKTLSTDKVFNLIEHEGLTGSEE